MNDSFNDTHDTPPARPKGWSEIQSWDECREKIQGLERELAEAQRTLVAYQQAMAKIESGSGEIGSIAIAGHAGMAGLAMAAVGLGARPDVTAVYGMHSQAIYSAGRLLGSAIERLNRRSRSEKTED